MRSACYFHYVCRQYRYVAMNIFVEKIWHFIISGYGDSQKPKRQKTTQEELLY